MEIWMGNVKHLKICINDKLEKKDKGQKKYLKK